jgi:hypothetical protein
MTSCVNVWKQNGKSASLTNDNSLEMENCNYNRDKHTLIDKNEFPDDLSELDPAFVKDVCESLKEHWLVLGLSSESYMTTPLIRNNKWNTKYIPRSTDRPQM